MNTDLSGMDPLIIYRCKNIQCKQMFTPSTLLNDAEQILYFECPICGSKYEAQYTNAGKKPNQEIIMLVERPRMIHIGTRIASS
ncbi:MAG: hypothetical protein ACTSO7_14365 [Candidatus Heimdallarchaeota archaeon]